MPLMSKTDAMLALARSSQFPVPTIFRYCTERMLIWVSRKKMPDGMTIRRLAERVLVTGSAVPQASLMAACRAAELVAPLPTGYGAKPYLRGSMSVDAASRPSGVTAFDASDPAIVS